MGAKSISVGANSRAIIGRYFQRLEAMPGLAWIDQVSMLFNSDQESETYKWLGSVPRLRQWIGGRQPNGLAENGMTIRNVTYEATLEVLLEELEYDKTGQVMVRVDELADSTNSHWAELLGDLIANGETGLCYDGQYFFDTDHAEGSSGTQSNSIQVDISALPCTVHGSTTDPSVEEAQRAIFKGIQQIYKVKDDRGRVINRTARSFAVLAGVDLLTTMEAAVAQPLVANGESNITRALSNINITPIVIPELNGWTSKFAVFRTDGALKPLIRQEQQKVRIAAVAEGSELEFNENKHRYGVSARRAVGYGMWQGSCLVTMA